MIYEYLPYILLALLGITFVIQLYYLLAVYSRLWRYKVTELEEGGNYPPVSVIICARNEEENIRKHLPAILEQDYPKFEVVLVNDYSEDETKWMLKDLVENYKHLKVVDIAEHVRLKHGKKFALTLGIKGAKYEHLVLTDADCEPQSSQWLRHMATGFIAGQDIVLGYSPYQKLPGFLNALVRFETFHTAISYLSYALGGDPYMGVGRNLAYTKELFFKGKGFASHMHIPSGDDDLFVNQNANRTNTTIRIHPDAQVWSYPKTSFGAYFQQKTRHAGASRAYRKRHQLMLSSQVVSALLFYLLVIFLAIVYPPYWPYTLGVWFVRFFIQGFIYFRCMKKLQVPDLIWWLPLLDVVYYFYTSLNGVLGRFKKDIRWK
ncbi:Glycosyltransferase, catalytic subunit of cellulose synthase and poly-beta-1,6-N-acetylglucosamine synthase [bacterium A37T11]|nr:Glycosyltransferase, catalytic subunit of cellulose synthase and poly-beta-1,6-N-acetylglucosamine synthase [bacterium A37T11]